MEAARRVPPTPLEEAGDGSRKRARAAEPSGRPAADPRVVAGDAPAGRGNGAAAGPAAGPAPARGPGDDAAAAGPGARPTSLGAAAEAPPSPYGLAREGFTVLRLWPPGEAAAVRQQLLAALFADSDEFEPSFLATCRRIYAATEQPASAFEGHVYRLVLSSLGNMGHGTAFHHPAVRAVHRAMFAAAERAARAAGLLRPGDACQMLADRATLRPPGTTVAFGNWHRDLPDVTVLRQQGRSEAEIAQILDDDVVLQSYVNLCDAAASPTLLFVGVPGSHFARGAREGPNAPAPSDGFTKVPPPPEGSWVTVPLAPGEMVLFFASMQHALAPHEVPATAPVAMRVHTGLRLTRDPRPLWLDLESALREQGCPRTPSGVPSGIIGLSSLGLPRAQTWLKAAFPAAIAAAVDAGKGSDGVLPSRRRLGLPLYPSYTAEELREYGIGGDAAGPPAGGDRASEPVT